MFLHLLDRWRLYQIAVSKRDSDDHIQHTYDRFDRAWTLYTADDSSQKYEQKLEELEEKMKASRSPKNLLKLKRAASRAYAALDMITEHPESDEETDTDSD